MTTENVNFIDIIKSRRSIRRFKEEKPPRELIEKILDIARWSPSGSNAQDWRFIVVQDEKLIKKLKMFSPGWINNANTAIIVCSDREWAYKVSGELGRDFMYLIHIGIVSQTISLVAHYFGLGTCMMLSFAKNAIKELLKAPESWDPVLIIAIGYPDVKPRAPPRLPLEKLVIWR